MIVRSYTAPSMEDALEKVRNDSEHKRLSLKPDLFANQVCLANGWAMKSLLQATLKRSPNRLKALDHKNLKGSAHNAWETRQ